MIKFFVLVPTLHRNTIKLTKQAKCPVFALGGMKPEDVPEAWSHGGQGIAAIRALWN
jgi:thiamine monophosphate synthase